MATCILCNRFKYTQRIEPTEEPHENPDTAIIMCRRCGTYAIEKTFAAKNQEGLGEDLGLALSAFVRESQRDGDGPAVEITAANYTELAAKASVPATFAGYIDRILTHLAKLSKYPGNWAKGLETEQLAAHACLPFDSYNVLLVQMQDQNLLQFNGRDPIRVAAQLKPDGWARVDYLLARHPSSNRAFVAMWFAPEMQPAFNEGIKPALIECGYEPPFRVDDPEHEKRAAEPDYQAKIDDRILAEIRRARFVVADMSGARPAVYYEAGFAQGLNIPIIWSCRAASATKDMCFDTRQIGHIIWENPQQLYEQLRDKLRARGWDLRREARG